MDTIHWKILEVLQKNSRASYTEIGKIVGLTAPAVADRIQNLENEGIIKHYGVSLNLEKLGYSVRAIINLKIFHKQLDNFYKELPNIKWIYECERITGDYCVSLKAAFKTPETLQKLINSLMVYGEPTTFIILSSHLENVIFDGK